MALLSVRSLGIAFGGVKALHDVSFDVRAGEIFSIIGPNGAGKTTLLNVATGIYTGANGDILLDGAAIKLLSPQQRAARGIQRTFQNLQIFRSMTAVENVLVGLHLQQKTGFLAALAGLPSVAAETREATDRAMQLLEELGLGAVADQQADTLSYGMQKRLEIARALAARPRLLLLDEPAAGLNGAETADISRVISDVARKHTTVVLVEHDMKMVMSISDRILVLNFGQYLATGTPAEIARHPQVVEAYLGTGAELDLEEAT